MHFLFITGIANVQQTRVKSKEGAQHYSNPILNRDFADPTVIRTANGNIMLMLRKVVAKISR